MLLVKRIWFYWFLFVDAIKWLFMSLTTLVNRLELWLISRPFISGFGRINIPCFHCTVCFSCFFFLFWSWEGISFVFRMVWALLQTEYVETLFPLPPRLWQSLAASSSKSTSSPVFVPTGAGVSFRPTEKALDPAYDSSSWKKSGERAKKQVC